MGSNWSPEAEYRCGNGCETYGYCPGHVMKIENHRGSDITTVWVDGKDKYWFDDAELGVLLRLMKQEW